MEFGEFKNTEGFNPTFKRIRELGLEENIFELDSYGFTVVPPDKVADKAFFERMRSTVLRICKERTGIDFDLASNGAFGDYKAQPQTEWPVPAVLPVDGGPCVRGVGAEPDALLANRLT